MKKPWRVVALAGAVTLTAVLLSGSAAAQTGPGYLAGPGEWGKIELLGQLTPEGVDPDEIADLAVYQASNGRWYAYLALWGATDCGGPETGGQTSPDGGVYIIDVTDLSNPVEVGFIATAQDTLVGEGMQVITITTPQFTGDVLLMNHEGCGKNYKAGVSLWDVTNPLKPRKLSENFGDITIGGVKDSPDVNQTHSAFMWDVGEKAYLVMVDDEEPQDVDIFDITNPKKPVLIAELDLNQYGVSQPELGLTDSFLHDVVVKQINGRWIMLLSYWDGGWVLLDVTNPAAPVFLSDTDYAAIDDELFEQTGARLSPEGNAHQAEFTIDNRFVIGTDEDFDPYRLQVMTAEGDAFTAKLGAQTTNEQATAISGTPVFVGLACPGDPVPAATGPNQIAVVERGVCLFEEKAQAVLAAGGYEAMIIMNREGADACTGTFGPSLTAEIPTIFIGRDAGFDLFDQPFNLAACLDGTQEQATIPIGTIGDEITAVSSVFDGWGYVRLFSYNAASNTLTEEDTFAIPEAMDPAFADGYGDLSVHEVAVDPLNPQYAYLSYYAGGLRAIEIVEDPARCLAAGEDDFPCLLEVGGYLSPTGNDFWGVETRIINGETIIFASDRDTGLWIFRDP
jgi:hypothetical protein